MKNLPMHIYFHSVPNLTDFPSGNMERETAEASLNKELDEISSLYWEHNRNAKQFRQFFIRFAIVSSTILILMVLAYSWE